MTYVYEIRHEASRKHYIGVADDVKRRWRRHVSTAAAGEGFKLHAAVRKHGAAAFTARVRAELPTQAEAFIAERILVALEKPEYNLTLGGDGVRATPEVRAKIAAKATGRKHTEATKAKLRAARQRQGNPPTPEFTAEHRERMRQAQLGRKQSEETKAKRSAALKLAYAEGRKQPVRGLPRHANGRIAGKALP